MNRFDIIVIMNEAMIKTLKDQNANYEENLKIKKYLNDESLFFKIDKVKAYEILKNVGVRRESIEEVYNSLIDPNLFYELYNKGIIKENDDNIIIKYNIYNSNNLFKNRK